MKLFQKFLKLLLLATTIGLLASIVAAGECTLLQSHPRSCAEPLVPVNTIPSVQSCSRQKEDKFSDLRARRLDKMHIIVTCDLFGLQNSAATQAARTLTAATAVL